MDYFTKSTEVEISHRKLEGYLKLAQIIQWGRGNPIGFCEQFLGIEFLDVQKWIFMNTWTKPNNLWCITRNGGKALALDTKIPTPTGYKTMQDIHIGDYVISEKGLPTKVIMVSPIFYDHDCYKITFEDGETIIADENHLWQINGQHNKIVSTQNLYSQIKKGKDIYIFDYKYKRKKIISIHKTISVPTKCIMVDNPTKLYLCGEHGTVTHNSTLTAPFIMAKGILITGHKTYILSNVSAQSQDTFMKIEDIAKKNITSFAGLTDFFKGEVITSTANKDGFTHAQSGFNYKLFNGSQVTSLSGDANNNRGKRSNLNIYDESGWITEEYISATTPFLLQNNDFKIGGGVDTETLPQQIPNQNLFISSASSTDSQFYKYYKEYSKKMLLGNRNYFVADIDCEVMLHPTSFGVTIKPLISKEKIQLDMSTNREKALREYYNKFSVDGGDGQVFKRADIIRNSIVRLPVLGNDSNTKRKFVFAYDPAETRDNSVIIVAELIEDENFGDRMEICNCIVFKDLKAKKKAMIQIPEQAEELKRLLLKYNGQKFADYENIECLLIDSGEGGGGKIIGDLCMPDWVDKNGIRHRGLIDKVEYKDYIKKFPNAINKMKMMLPQKYKKQLFDALSEMINQNLFSFPAEYSGKGYIMLPKETGKEIEVNNEGKITKEKEIKYNKIKIDNNQGLALKNIDLAKEELVHIYRTKSSNGNYSYSLQKEVENKMHDDKAYCLALLGWYLQEIRRSRIVNKKAPKIDYSKMPSLISHISL